MLKVLYKKRTLSGEEEAFEKVVAERRAQCASCDNRKTYGPISICGLCKCNINMKTGTRGASCPIQKW